MSYTVYCTKCNYINYAREAQEKSKVNGIMCHHKFETSDIDFITLLNERDNYKNIDDCYQCIYCKTLFKSIENKLKHHLIDKCVHIYLPYSESEFDPKLYFDYLNFANNSICFNTIELDSLFEMWAKKKRINNIVYETFMSNLYQLDQYLNEKKLPNFLVPSKGDNRYYTIDFDIFTEAYIEFIGDYSKIYNSFDGFFSYMYKSSKFLKRTSIQTMYNSYKYYSSHVRKNETVIFWNYDFFRNSLIKYIEYLKSSEKPVFILLDNHDIDKYILDRQQFNLTYNAEKNTKSQKRKREELTELVDSDTYSDTYSNSKNTNINMNTNSSNGYIYLLQEREFIKTGEPIYKLGKTTKTIQERLQGYPKGSRLILCIEVEDCHSKEKKLLDKFRTEFKLRKDIGNEYFEGDKNTMVKYIR